METLHSFLSARYKQNGLTAVEFCKKIGISRQKFYRIIKEPARFPAESVQGVINVLSLNEEEARQLRSYLDPQRQTGLNPPDLRGRTPALSDYSGLINGLLRHKPSEELLPDLDSIEFMDQDCNFTLESPASFARMIAAEQADNAAGPAVPTAASHEFMFTIYNCIPAISGTAGRQPQHSGSILLLAGLIKELEDILIPVSPVNIRIRHYLSELQRIQTSNHSPDDPDTAELHLRILDSILPLLSMAADYNVDLSGALNNTSAEFANCCMIRHTCSTGDKAPYVEYYMLLFASGDKCRACRIGSAEVSRLYRFFTADVRGAESPAVKKKGIDPNLFYLEMDRERRPLLIHPDLCFDDIPADIWLSLYDVIEKRRDRLLYESAFRKLMDPYDLYPFMDFKDLAAAMIDTVEKRYRAAAVNGKIVICHPEGLQSMVRTGLISDLSEVASVRNDPHGDPDPLRFPAPVIRSLLHTIRSGILRRMESDITDPSGNDRINYYIMQPGHPYPEISFLIYDGYGVAPFYTMGRHKNKITNIFESAEAGSVLYDYIVQEMIGRRGEKLRTAIMSDEHSVSFLDRLIAMSYEGERL